MCLSTYCVDQRLPATPNKFLLQCDSASMYPIMLCFSIQCVTTTNVPQHTCNPIFKCVPGLDVSEQPMCPRIQVFQHMCCNTQCVPISNVSQHSMCLVTQCAAVHVSLSSLYPSLHSSNKHVASESFTRWCSRTWWILILTAGVIAFIMLHSLEGPVVTYCALLPIDFTSRRTVFKGVSNHVIITGFSMYANYLHYACILYIIV